MVSDARQDGSEPHRTQEYQGPVGLRGSTIRLQDLTSEWTLAECARTLFQGEERPTLGGIVLVAKLGRGGMGYVFRGVHPDTGDEVAVKVLPRAVHDGHEQALARFLREGRLAAELNHPNVVRVQSVGQDKRTEAYYLVMECIRGMTAGAWVRTFVDEGASGAPEIDSLDIIIAACRGVAAAHAAGIIHRDIKPDNILLPVDDDGTVGHANAKVTDLGLARFVEDHDGLTKSATGLGTAGVMAPEQLENAKHATAAADVFSLGATLYVLLTGAPPFEGTSLVMVIMNTMRGKFASLAEKRPDVDAELVGVVERCLARAPADRYADADELLVRLEAIRARLG